MTKRFCDVCGAEMVAANTPTLGSNGARLEAEVRRRARDNDSILLKVEVVQSVNGTSNDGDVCKHCILDALYRLDDRPKEALAR